MLKKIKNISEIGVREFESESTKNQIILLNRLNVLVSIIYFFIGCIYFSFGDFNTAFYLTLLIIINGIAFVAQKKYLRLFSESLFLIASYLSIFYFDSYTGKEAGAYLYYLPILASLFLLFDIKTEQKLLGSHILLVFMLIGTNYFTNYTLFKSDLLSLEMKSNLFIGNSIFSILSAFYILYLFLKKRRN